MDIFDVDCYKTIVKHRLKAARGTRRALTLRKVAERIPVQYTYLSRVLNDPDHHLNEDHLFTICRLLDFLPDEIEYMSLLRAVGTTGESGRRKYLQGRLNHVRRTRRLHADVQDFQSADVTKEMVYLFDPMSIVVHVSLDIEEYRANPRRLCAALGLTPEKLKEILRRLRDLDFIELGEDGYTVSRLLKGHIHYSSDHPLMRVHQSLLRTLCASRIPEVSEEHKQDFMVTFSGDPETFRVIKEAFNGFLKQIEPLVVKSKSKHAYQMNFSLFKWL